MTADSEIIFFFKTSPYFLAVLFFSLLCSCFTVVYTQNEKVDIICQYLSGGRSAKGAAVAFNAANPGRNVRHKYVIDLFRKFRETGSVNRKEGSGRPSTDEVLETGVLGEIFLNPRRSLREMEQVIGKSVHFSTIRRLLKKHKFRPYKQRIVHELCDGDEDRRLEYCEMMSERFLQDPELIKSICFSDESVFFLDGRVNTQNSRYWSQTNPHEFYESRSQFPRKLNVWAGIFRSKIVGPFFFDGNLDGPKYLEMLEQQIVPRIREISVETNLPVQQAYFQQDGAPPHYSLIARAFVDLAFPGRWIGRRGPIEWPPRSPDLTPLDFFLWGHLKTVVYDTKPVDLEDLRARIVLACAEITSEEIDNVYRQAEQRLYLCMEVGGGHIENLI